MSVVVAEGVVEVTADATGVPRQVAKDIDDNGAPVEAAGKGVGKKIFGGILAGWAAIGGINAVVSFFSGAVTGASDLNETMSKSQAIFGDQQSTMTAWSNNAAKTLGLSQSAALNAAAGFGDMFAQIGFTGAEAANMSKSVVQAAADLGSFSNLDTADVSERIAAAFRGEYDSLQAVIPNISAARVESEAMAATGKKTAASLTAQEKAAAVLAIVHKDGARAMGDFERTSSGAANSSKIVTASFEDQKNKLGARLLPMWQGFLGFLANTALPVFRDTVSWISKNGQTIGILAGVLGTTAVLYTVATTAGTIYKAYQVAAAASTGGLTVAQWLLNAAMTANPIGIVVVAIGALVGALIWVATQTTFFQDTWANVTSFIGTAWGWLWDNVLNPVFTAIGTAFNWLYTNVIAPIILGIEIYIGLWAAVFVWLWDTVLNPIFTGIGIIFNWLYTNVIAPVVKNISLLIQGWGLIFTWLHDTVIKPVFDKIGQVFNWVLNTVVKPTVAGITWAFGLVGNAVHDVFGGISSFIGSAFQSVLGVVRGPINGLIGLINGVIGKLNSIHVTIPGWVPGVGGQTFGLNLPRIPMLARGSRNAPDTFIAGENGPELITGARGSRVYSNNETRDMFSGSGGPSISIGSITLDASKFKTLQDLIDMIEALPQVARSGRGSVGMAS